jgi:hypothetical protein
MLDTVTGAGHYRPADEGDDRQTDHHPNKNPSDTIREL